MLCNMNFLVGCVLAWVLLLLVGFFGLFGLGGGGG